MPEVVDGFAEQRDAEQPAVLILKQQTVRKQKRKFNPANQYAINSDQNPHQSLQHINIQYIEIKKNTITIY